MAWIQLRWPFMVAIRFINAPKENLVIHHSHFPFHLDLSLTLFRCALSWNAEGVSFFMKHMQRLSEMWYP
jgi:hypothetical protein